MQLCNSLKATCLCKVKRSKRVKGCKMTGCGTNTQPRHQTILLITIITINKLIRLCSAKKSLSNKPSKLTKHSLSDRSFYKSATKAYHKRKPNSNKQLTKCEDNLLPNSNLTTLKSKLNKILLKQKQHWMPWKTISPLPKREFSILSLILTQISDG